MQFWRLLHLPRLFCKPLLSHRMTSTATRHYKQPGQFLQTLRRCFVLTFHTGSTIFRASQTVLVSTPQQRPPASSSKASDSTSRASLPPLPYHVQRTASQELPIYHIAKRGGNLHQTRIRKIRGDIIALRDELQTSLKLKKENAAVNQLTGHIILKVCTSFSQQRYRYIRGGLRADQSWVR